MGSTGGGAYGAAVGGTAAGAAVGGTAVAAGCAKFSFVDAKTVAPETCAACGICAVGAVRSGCVGGVTCCVTTSSLITVDCTAVAGAATSA